MNENEKENLPYFREYKGKITSDGINIRFKPSFEKELKKHLKNKYPNQLTKDGKINYNECIRFVLEDYLQHQCLQQKVFEKTLVCFADGLEVDESQIELELTANGFTRNVKKNLFAKATASAEFDNYSLVKFNPKFTTTFKKRVNEFKTIKECDSVFVVEIPLNNNLDSYQDGVYKYKNMNNYHGGVNLIQTTTNVVGIYYEWEVLSNGAIILKSIEFIESNAILDLLKDKDTKVYKQAMEDLSPNAHKLRLKHLIRDAERELSIKQKELDEMKSEYDKI